MTCRMIRRHIPTYAAGELNGLAAWMVERHLCRCDRCMSEVERYQKLSSWVFSTRQIDQPMSNLAWDTVRARMLLGGPEPVRLSRSFWPLIPVALGALAFVLFNGVQAEQPTGTVAATPAKAPVTANVGRIFEAPAVKESVENRPEPRTQTQRVHRRSNENQNRPRAMKPRIYRAPQVEKAEPSRYVAGKSAAFPAAAPLHRPNISGEGPTKRPREIDRPDGTVTEINVRGDQIGESVALEHDSSQIHWSY